MLTIDKIRGYGLPIFDSRIKTVQELRKLKPEHFKTFLNSEFPNHKIRDELELKYGAIYIVQSLMTDPGNEIGLLEKSLERAKVLIENHPFIDCSPQMPEFTETSESIVKKPPKYSGSLLSQVKQFCDDYLNGHQIFDRKSVINLVIEEFDIDKAKASTYVHLFMKENNLIKKKKKDGIPK